MYMCPYINSPSFFPPSLSLDAQAFLLHMHTHAHHMPLQRYMIHIQLAHMAVGDTNLISSRRFAMNPKACRGEEGRWGLEKLGFQPPRHMSGYELCMIYEWIYIYIWYEWIIRLSIWTIYKCIYIYTQYILTPKNAVNQRNRTWYDTNK